MTTDGGRSVNPRRSGVSWGLRLERAGRRGEDRMRVAAEVAEEMRPTATPDTAMYAVKRAGGDGVQSRP